MDLGMLLIKAIILGMIVTGVLGFFLVQYLSKSTEGAVSRLNKETEEVRGKHSELNEKIKEANEELTKRRGEADALVVKMKDEAEEKAKEEREKIIKKAREDGEEIINKAQKTKDEVRKILEKEMVMKAVDLTRIVLGEVLTEKSLVALDESLITDYIDSFKEVDVDMITDDIDTAVITTAKPMPDKLKINLSEVLKNRLGRDIKIDASADEKIIAGIVLKFGNLSLDGSLASMVKDRSVSVKERIEKGLLKV